jgi:hypothetical protein
MDNKEIHKFECGFVGTLYDHRDNCYKDGWHCIEDGLLKQRGVKNGRNI